MLKHLYYSPVCPLHTAEHLAQTQEQYVFLDYQCTDWLVGAGTIIPSLQCDRLAGTHTFLQENSGTHTHSFRNTHILEGEFWGLPAGFFKCLLTCVEKPASEKQLLLSDGKYESRTWSLALQNGYILAEGYKVHGFTICLIKWRERDGERGWMRFRMSFKDVVLALKMKEKGQCKQCR